MAKQNVKKTSGNKQSKKATVSKKSTINSKKNNITKQKENNMKKIIMIIVAIVILIIILLSLFGCENKNDIDKLQGNVNNEEVKDKEKDDDKVEVKQEESKDNFNIHSSYTNNKINISDATLNPTVISKEDLEAQRVKTATEAVEKAEETLDKDDILFAEDLVENLEDSKEKDELDERVENLIDAYNVTELVERLEKLTYEATDKEEVKIAIDYRSENDIINLVENLQLEDVKESLQERLKKLEPILDDNTDPIIINVEDGESYKTKVMPGVIEENIRSIKVNGESYVIGQELEDGIYTMVVVDMAFNEDKVSFVIDTTKPELTLVGDENIMLEYMKDTYEEQGALYSDNIDGDKTILEPTLITMGASEVTSVDTGIVGVYKLAYEATDTAGNTNKVVRTVVVSDTILPTAKAIAYYKNGKYRVVLFEINEEIINDGSWTDGGDTLEKEFEKLPSSVKITDVNGNDNDIVVVKEENVPQITVNVNNKEDYKIEYKFDITDESDLEVVKIAKGAYSKEYFASNGTSLTENNYLVYENGDYTIYVKDMMGNDVIKTFTVSDIKESTIALNGIENIELEYKTSVYKEEGATYYNNVNAPGYIENPTKITKNGLEVSNVDVNSVGVYKLEYTTTDALGKAMSVTRTVTVKDTVYPTATATVYVVNGKYIVKLTNISEEIINDGSWINDTKEFSDLPSIITITDVNNNQSEIMVNNETIAPSINENGASGSDYKKVYSFNITDDSDIEIVKIASGSHNKEYFVSNGTVLNNPYSYEIYENGSYTVYAKDVLGNESVKTINVNTIKKAEITDEELKNAFLISNSESSYDDYMLTYTKTVKINPNNRFEIKEIKVVATTLEYNDITIESFKNNKIHGSDVITIDKNATEFKLVDHVGASNDNYHYVYYLVQEGEGTNIATREFVIEVAVSPVRD